MQTDLTQWMATMICREWRRQTSDPPQIPAGSIVTFCNSRKASSCSNTQIMHRLNTIIAVCIGQLSCSQAGPREYQNVSSTQTDLYLPTGLFPARASALPSIGTLLLTTTALELEPALTMPLARPVAFKHEALLCLRLSDLAQH
jgi:hypothetical protein